MTKKKGITSDALFLIFLAVIIVSFTLVFYHTFIASADVRVFGDRLTQGRVKASAIYGRVLSSPDCFSTGEMGVFNETLLEKKTGSIEIEETVEVKEEIGYLYIELKEEPINWEEIELTFGEVEEKINDNKYEVTDLNEGEDVTAIYEYGTEYNKDILECAYDPDLWTMVKVENLDTGEEYTFGTDPREVYMVTEDHQMAEHPYISDFRFHRVDYETKVNIDTGNELQVGRIKFYFGHIPDPLIELAKAAQIAAREEKSFEDPYEITLENPSRADLHIVPEADKICGDLIFDWSGCSLNSNVYEEKPDVERCDCLHLPFIKVDADIGDFWIGGGEEKKFSLVQTGFNRVKIEEN